MTLEYEIKGLAELEAAIRRNPAYVLSRARAFIVRGLSEYRRVIWRNPWRVGMAGGGAPVRTGNLRDTHQQLVQDLEGRVFPTATYSRVVHDGSRYIEPRPWLDRAKQDADPAIREYEGQLLDDIAGNLAT